MSNQLWDYKPPSFCLDAHARKSDPQTSHEAAASISKQQRMRSHEQVLNAFIIHGPMCDKILATKPEVAGMTPSRIRTARCELTRLQVLEDTGETVPMYTGTKVLRHKIWRI